MCYVLCAMCYVTRAPTYFAPPDSEAFAKAMLAEIGVAVTPGIDFDPVHGRNYLRFSYAGPEPAMREAARRIKNWTA